jgi:uncharacterized protein (DUF4415 family)
MKKQKKLINKNGEIRELEKNEEIELTPLSAKFPELAEYSISRKRGRPKKDAPKKLQSFKLSQDVINAIKASGAGYNTKVERALREFFIEGRT